MAKQVKRMTSARKEALRGVCRILPKAGIYCDYNEFEEMYKHAGYLELVGKAYGDSYEATLQARLSKEDYSEMKKLFKRLDLDIMTPVWYD